MTPTPDWPVIGPKLLEAATKIREMARNYRSAGFKTAWTDEIEDVLGPAINNARAAIAAAKGEDRT